MAALNETHDPSRASWVESANAPDADFPVQNLPFGLFRASGETPRGGVAIGDQVLDLAALLDAGLLRGQAETAARAATGPTLNPLLEQPAVGVAELRLRLSDLLRSGGGAANAAKSRSERLLRPRSSVELLRPVRAPAFTDFCCSIDHIRRLAPRGRELQPAWTHLPVAYNGRASSVAASGRPVVRPLGQFQPRGGPVTFGPEPSLDFELELGVYLSPVPGAEGVAGASQALFGCSLVNDWSARGIQFFETMLGPFLGKSFLTSVSPWIVTLEALAPYRVPARPRGPDETPVPAHLSEPADQAQGALAIELTAWLATPAMREAGGAPHRIVRTRFEDMYWTFAQMVAHQASNGCPLEPGDLVASGTVSGPAEESRACLAEITERGTQPLALPNGERRSWLEDGDELILRGRAAREGYAAIGFGDCTGRIEPALPANACAAPR